MTKLPNLRGFFPCPIPIWEFGSIWKFGDASLGQGKRMPNLKTVQAMILRTTA
jgi:hypothetical protein